MKSFSFKTEWIELISSLDISEQAVAFNAIVHFAKTGEEIAHGIIKETIKPIIDSIKLQDQRRILRNIKARERRLAKKNLTVEKKGASEEISLAQPNSDDKPSGHHYSANSFVNIPGFKFKKVFRSIKPSRRRYKNR